LSALRAWPLDGSEAAVLHRDSRWTAHLLKTVSTQAIMCYVPEISSFQAQLAGLSEGQFVGREAEIDLFEGTLVASPRPFLILSIWGQGGVGKSTLVERFGRIAAEHGATLATSDHEQSDVPTTLARLASALGEAGHELNEFGKLERRYWELRHGIASDPAAPPGVLDFLVRGAAGIAVRSASLVPGGAEVRDVVLGPNASAHAADFGSAALAYIAQRFKKNEKVLLLETVRVLTEAFLADVDRLTTNRAVVLVFDTHERTAEYLDKWLLDLLAGGFGQFSVNVLFVISGRDRLGHEWNAIRGAIREVELDVFDQDEARRYLSSRGVTDDAHAAEFLRVSSRLPVLLAFLTSGGRSAGEATGDAVERFLQGVSRDEQEAALVASVPRVFDEDVLAVLLGERAPAAFASLSKASYVRAGTRGWAYHDVVRTLMLRHFYHRSPVRCAELHGRLAAFYATRCAGLGVPTEQQSTDEDWLVFDTERLYHSLWASARRAIVPFLDAALDHVTYWGRLPLRYVDLLEHVAEEMEDPILRGWSRDLRTIVASEASKEPGDVTASLRATTRLCELDGLSARSRASALLVRGSIHSRANNRDRALEDFSAGIALDPESSELHASRGFERILALEVEAGVADLAAAARLSRSPEWLLWAMGNLFAQGGVWQLAAHFFSRAIDQKPDVYAFHLSRGMALMVSGSDEARPQAERDLTRAIELDPGAAAPRYWRGKARAGGADTEGALEDLELAAELDPLDGGTHAWRALVLLELGEPARARTAADTGLELGASDEDRALALQARAIARQQEGDVRGALADIAAAEALKPNVGMIHQLRTDALLALGEHAEALAECERAMELGDASAGVHVSRGRALLGLSRVAEGRAELEHAYELNPKEARAAYYLASSWAKEGKADEAGRWLQAALQLEPGLVEDAQSEPDFDPVRGTPALGTILGPSPKEGGSSGGSSEGDGSSSSSEV
jgi:tetratricopeptide (TPR) repeat protein